MRTWIVLLAAGSLVGATSLQPEIAGAGCGCDHPPPIQGYVFPRFGWAERQIAVYAPGLTAAKPCVRVGGESFAGGDVDGGLCAGGTRPQVLTLRYTGASCAASRSAQKKVRCSGDPAAAAGVLVTAQQLDGEPRTWFSGPVDLGAAFDLDAKRIGLTRLDGTVRVVIRSLDGGQLLQDVTFDASCAEPLSTGDAFGALTLVRLTPEYETTADLARPDEAHVRLGAAEPGPKTVSVFNVPCDELGRETPAVTRYADSEFTMLPAPLPVVELQGTMRYEAFDAAVAGDGTLLVPFDLTNVIQPMQFFVILRDLPLRFAVDDVVYYNRDQYNLKMFERVVSGPEDYQWGPFYGTTTTASGKALGSSTKDSDAFGYWRHEFESYRAAHAPGGAFEVGANGLHPDGTPHIDHSHVVLALRGWLVDPEAPDDRSRWRRLTPGKLRLDVEVRQLLAATPAELTALSAEQRRALYDNRYTVAFDARTGVLAKVRREPVWPSYDQLTALAAGSKIASASGAR